MRTTLLKLMGLLGLTFYLAGCATFETNAYRSLSTLAFSVDGAMHTWGDWVKAGRATVEEELAVKNAYERYQASMRVCRQAIVEYRTGATNRTGVELTLDIIDASRIELLALISTLKK